MEIKIYLFDLDDTLIDTKIYQQIYQPILQNIQKKLKLNSLELELKAKELGLKRNKYGRWDTGDLCRKLGFLKMYYQELEKQIQVMPVLHRQVRKVFNKIKQKGKKIGIVSNSMIKTIQLFLDKYQLSESVDFIFSRDQAGCLKNDQKYWQKLIKLEKLNPKECLMIGDHPLEDIKIPKDFGFNTLHLVEPEDLGWKLKV